MLKENNYTQNISYEVNSCTKKPLAWPIFSVMRNINKRKLSLQTFGDNHNESFDTCKIPVYQWIE